MALPKLHANKFQKTSRASVSVAVAYGLLIVLTFAAMTAYLTQQLGSGGSQVSSSGSSNTLRLDLPVPSGL